MTRQTWDGPRPLAGAATWLTSGWYRKETAVALDTFRQLIADLERTVPASEKEAAGRWEHIMVPNLRAVVVRYRETEAARLLAMSAVATYRDALAEGSYGAGPTLAPGADPDPFAGGALVFERHEDGSARLSAPAAAELWTKLNDIPRRLPPPFVWELPAVD